MLCCGEGGALLSRRRLAGLGGTVSAADPGEAEVGTRLAVWLRIGRSLPGDCMPLLLQDLFLDP